MLQVLDTQELPWWYCRCLVDVLSPGGFIHPSLVAAPAASSTNILAIRINKPGKKFSFISEQRFV